MTPGDAPTINKIPFSVSSRHYLHQTKHISFMSTFILSFILVITLINTLTAIQPNYHLICAGWWVTSAVITVMTMVTYWVSDSGSAMMSPCSSSCVSPVSSMGQGNGSFPWVTQMATGWGHSLNSLRVAWAAEQPEPTCPRCRAEQLLAGWSAHCTAF